ncbi:MAG: hypothetical protein ACO3JL_04355 [Myxococcota bacterium]
MRLTPSKLSSALFLLSMPLVPGCACGDVGGFSGLTDPTEPDAGPAPPPPPVFPLAPGDELVIPGLGGRTEPCSVEGQCDRAAKATFVINDVTLDDATNTWSINADYAYEGTADAIPAAGIGQLFLSRAVPFADLAAGTQVQGTADFETVAAPTDALTPNGFPFFHFEEAYATRDDSAYRQAAAVFTTRILELDPDAEVENQAAEAKLEAYFKDELGVNAMLHKIRIDYHPFGFICGWDERLAAWTEGMGRNDNAFTGTTTPLAAIFASPVRLLRDDKRYTCSCSTRQCRDASDSSLCLDPSDPDRGPVPCACLSGSAAGADCD